MTAAAVRVFARDGYRSAHMSDVAREAGLSEAALYRDVERKEGLFVLAIRHALLLEPLPGESDKDGEFPLKAPPLSEMIRQAGDFVAAEVPFGALAAALRAPDTGDPAGELELVMRELFALEEQTARAADMIERPPWRAARARRTAQHGPAPPGRRAHQLPGQPGQDRHRLRVTPDTAATARLVLETLTWFARHRHSDPSPARRSRPASPRRQPSTRCCTPSCRLST